MSVKNEGVRVVWKIGRRMCTKEKLNNNIIIKLV